MTKAGAAKHGSKGAAAIISRVAEGSADIAWNAGVDAYSPSDDFEMLDSELGRAATADECARFCQLANSAYNRLLIAGGK